MDSCFSKLNDFSIARDRARAASQSEPRDREIRVAVRRAVCQDVPDLAEVLARSFHPRVGLMGWLYPLLKLGIYQDLHGRLQESSERYLCLAAIATGSHRLHSEQPTAPAGVAGTVELAVRSSPFSSRPRYAYISNLAVSPSQRRQGIARKLLSSCEPMARAWGFREIYLHVLEDNHQARNLYASIGYRLYRIESNWWGGWFDRPRRLLLHKSLEKGA